MSRAVAEGDRRQGNVLMIGKVTGVNPGAATARVDLGGLPSPELPVGQLRAGALSFWWMPSVGEQVLVGCPSGDVAQGVIICAIFAGNAPSSNAAVPMIDLAGGEMEIKGTLKITGDVVAQGVSLVTHTHKDVAPGASNTGVPNR